MIDMTKPQVRKALRRVTGIGEIRDLLRELGVVHEFRNGGSHTRLRLLVGGQHRDLTLNNSGQQHSGAAHLQLKQIRAAVTEMRRAMLAGN